MTHRIEDHPGPGSLPWHAGAERRELRTSAPLGQLAFAACTIVVEDPEEVIG